MALVAVLFGVADALAIGNGSDGRSAIARTSPPWLLLAFTAGAVAGRRRIVPAAVSGVTVSLLALGSFYLAESFASYLGSPPWLFDLRMVIDGGKGNFALAALSGPAFGAFGGRWAHRRSSAILPGMAALFMLEPIAAILHDGSREAPPSRRSRSDPNGTVAMLRGTRQVAAWVGSLTS